MPSKGKVHEVFIERLKQLQANAKEMAASARSGIRPWQIPTALKDVSLLSIAKLHEKAFEREPINTNYQETMQDSQAPGTVGDTMSLKTQIDYNAMEERAFRARHSTVCRAIVHGHGRRAGHGESSIFAAVQRQAENLIKAGAG